MATRRGCHRTVAAERALHVTFDAGALLLLTGRLGVIDLTTARGFDILSKLSLVRDTRDGSVV